MGLIVSRWTSMLNVAIILVLVTASGCKMSSWSIPGMSWMGGSKKEVAEAPLNQPATTNQAIPSANASKYLTPPTISTGTPTYSGTTATASSGYSNGPTTAYSGRNTQGPYHPPKTTSLPAAQPATPQYPATQYPATASRYPATQYPATTGQYPATQYPATTATQTPATQFGSPTASYPPGNYAPVTKTADSRNATPGSPTTPGTYQNGFYAPERSTTGANQAPATTTPQGLTSPPSTSYGQGAANSYVPTTNGQTAAPGYNTLPATKAPAASPTSAYGTQDPYAGQVANPAYQATGSTAPQQPATAPYRPGSTGRLNPSSVPQQPAAYPQPDQSQDYPTRSSAFSP